jgi:hypothetical protein
MSEKNQYGRRTWDVEAYAFKNDEKRTKRENIVDNLSENGIIRQTQIDNETIFGIENSWFTCKLCNRRFKDSLKLSEHYGSKQHIDNVSRLNKGKKEEMEITLDNVKSFLNGLKNRTTV